MLMGNRVGNTGRGRLGSSSREPRAEDKQKKLNKEEKHEIFQAVGKGDVETLEKFISSGVNVTEVVDMSPLHYASRHGHSSMVESLIKCGAKVNAVDNYQLTPLHYASRFGHSSIVKSLIEYGAEVNAMDNNQYTPLHFASRFDDSSVAESLIKCGARVDAVTKAQVTPLHLASNYGHSSIVESLIKYGAKVNAVDKNRSTPLHLASKHGHSLIVENLIKCGADVNAVDNGLVTPLFTSSQNGHISSVERLIEHEAKVDIVDKCNRTPLDIAVKYNRCDVVYYFINKLKMDITQLDQATHQRINELLKEAEEKQDKQTELEDTQQESIEVILEKLEQAKANNETLKVSYTTILFSGSSGVGKTSLLKKLSKENVNRYHHSTGVAKSKHTVCIKSTAVIKSTKGLHWVDLDYDFLIKHLNKHLHNLRLPSLTSMSAASLSLEKDAYTDLDKNLPNPKIYPFSSTAASSSMDNTLNATTSKNVIIPSRKTVDKVQLAATDIAKADSSDTPELGDVWDIINFLDTGGQPEFVNILPAVSNSIALTFIVFNLSKSLNDFVHVEHNVNGDPSFKPYYLDCSNEEFIKRLMVSSESFKRTESLSLQLKGTRRKDDGNDSKICYIGTHACKINDEQIEKIDMQLSSIANELELHQRSFWSSPQPQLKRLFPIDMFSSGKEQESYEKTIQIIRDNIHKQVQGQDYFEVPIIWLIFLLNLQKLCNIKKSSYISYQEAVEVWRDENVSKNDVGNESDEDLYDDQHINVSRNMSEVHNILLFFHFIGMLFYYHKVEGMCDYVFIDRQWLFEKLTELVEIKFTKGYNKEDINAEDIDKFTMEGRLNINIIRNLKINLQGIEPLYFIYLLDHLNIVAPIDSKLKYYFMPCVLPSFPPTKPLEKTYDLDKCYGSIQYEPLLVGFKNGPMPHGFFCQLIVELLKRLPTGWNSPLLSTSRMQHTYNNLITFPTTSGHAVSLFYKIGYIEVQMRHKSSQPSVIHYNVRYELDKILKTVSGHLQLNIEQLCYGFYCKCEEIQHFAKLKSSTSPMEYIFCDYGYTKLTDGYKVWLQEPKGISSQPIPQIVKEPNMKWMHKIIIPNVSYCWKIVADYLEYPAAKKREIEERQRGDPYKCCAELMEDWLTSDRGVTPKTWQTLVSVLKDIQELSTSSIEQCLLKEGLLSPPETVPTLQTAAVTLPSTGTNENRNEALRKDTLQVIDDISANTTENASHK